MTQQEKGKILLGVLEALEDGAATLPERIEYEGDKVRALPDPYLNEKVIIRTVTYHYVGYLVAVTDTEYVLDDASWVADSGRWHKALAEGKLSEVEPYPGEVRVSKSAVVDRSTWEHSLPREPK